MELAPRKTAVKCNSHHRQGISLSTDRKTRIDLKKLAVWIDFERVCQEKSQVEFRLGFFQRCVPLARNVMCPSGVMFASQVMCASRVRRAERITSLCTVGAIHHYGEAITSLRRSRNITLSFFTSKPADRFEPAKCIF